MFPKAPQYSSEAWRVVAQCPLYEVSNLGNVRRAAAGQGARAGHVLKWSTHTSSGYPNVRLTSNNKSLRFNVHSLVAAAFLGDRPEGYVIRHLDGDKLNPNVSNLAYGTPKQNSQDDIAHGKTHKGEKNGNAKLCAEQVLIAKERHAQGKSLSGIAREYGVAASTVIRSVRGATWKHVRT